MNKRQAKKKRNYEEFAGAWSYQRLKREIRDIIEQNGIWRRKHGYQKIRVHTLDKLEKEKT